MTSHHRTVLPATMDTYYASGEAPDIDDGCEVVLTEDELVISYDCEGAVVYRGRAIAPGHYEVFSEEEGGRAVMHCVPGGSIIVGCWRVGGYSGLWKVDIQRSE